jgi:tetrahydromethanopterin S-methyltransferase subunit G
MTAKDTYEAVMTVDGKDIGKGTRIVLEALVKDGEEMKKRIDSIEDKVDKISNDVSDLKELVKESIERKQSFIKLLSEVVHEAKFWLWVIILTVLAFGVSITDLKGLIGG